MDRWPLFDGIDQAEVRRVLDASRKRMFERGEVLFHEGDPGDSLHLIKRGRVAVRITTARGDVATIDLYGPGDVVGELAVLNGGRRMATVRAIEASETLEIHRGDFDELRRSHPGVNDVLLRILAQKLTSASARAVEALFAPADKRIRAAVLRLAEVFTDEGGIARIPVTQDEIATIAGSTRSTVSRVLQKEIDRGTIALARGVIEVLDPAALARRAH